MQKGNVALAVCVFTDSSADKQLQQHTSTPEPNVMLASDAVKNKHFNAVKKGTLVV